MEIRIQKKGYFSLFKDTKERCFFYLKGATSKIWDAKSYSWGSLEAINTKRFLLFWGHVVRYQAIPAASKLVQGSSSNHTGTSAKSTVASLIRCRIPELN